MDKIVINVVKAVVLSAMQDERVQARAKDAAIKCGEAVQRWAAEAPKLRLAR